jgi:hypothetical protein
MPTPAAAWSTANARCSALGDHLKRWGRLLPDGQTLKLEVLDVDLAGEIEPYGWHQVRFCAAGPTGPR